MNASEWTPKRVVKRRPKGKAKQAILARCLRRQKGKCYYCGIVMTACVVGTTPTATAATIEHLLPMALGGTNDDSNLAAACYECNNSYSKRISKVVSDEHKRRIGRAAQTNGASIEPINDDASPPKVQPNSSQGSDKPSGTITTRSKKVPYSNGATQMMADYPYICQIRLHTDYSAPKLPLPRGRHRMMIEFYGCARRPRIGESGKEFQEYAKQSGTWLKTTFETMEVE